MDKTTTFIEKVNKVHNNKFNYAKVDYTNQNTKVVITCPNHGDFIQTPKSHLSGRGCIKCGQETSSKVRSMTTTQFIEKAKEVHEDRYDYSKTVYSNKRTPVTMTCKLHGDISVIPGNHIHSKSGCSKCKAILVGHVQTKSTDDFIKEAQNIHKNTYDYTNTKYIGARDKVDIQCHTHGAFSQRPSDHLSGNGCPKCAIACTGWSDTAWEIAGKASANFTGFKLYILECWNDTERFIKIGKTFNSISKRFNNTNIPYEWKLIHTEEGSAKYISELERELHTNNSKHTYTPQKDFGGRTECFTLEASEHDK